MPDPWGLVKAIHGIGMQPNLTDRGKEVTAERLDGLFAGGGADVVRSMIRRFTA